MNRKNEQQTKARRQQILDAAVICFRKGGFHGASLADIAEAAGMSTGHMYYYIKNKDELVEAIVAREHAKLKVYIEQLKELVTRPAEAVAFIKDVIRKEADEQEFVLLSQIYAEASINPVVAAILDKRNKMFRQEMRDLLESCIESGQISQDVDLEAAVGLIVVLSLGLVTHAAIAREESQAMFGLLERSGLNRLLPPPVRTGRGHPELAGALRGGD